MSHLNFIEKEKHGRSKTTADQDQYSQGTL